VALRSTILLALCVNLLIACGDLPRRPVLVRALNVGPPVVGPIDDYATADQDPTLLRTARKMLGHPYRWGGYSPDKGFDCSGLIYYVYGQHGRSVPRTAEAQYAYARPVAFSQIRPGDLVFFRLYRNDVSHVGIYLGEYLFIHAPSTGKRVTYSSLRDAFWQTRFVGAGRIL